MPKLTIQTLREDYENGTTSVREVVRRIYDQIEQDPDPAVFIYRLNESELEPYFLRLDSIECKHLPLYGIPFVIKDNIDLAAVPTTAACPDYEYIPEQSAFVVEQLIEAGAIPLGKTNLDQFATGLVGVRSPYGIPINPINPDYIPGGSSSGSATAVARGYAAFSLGTDTAGSGRVPAAFNELIGLKPTRGVLSNSGVVPACKSLDCVSIFANNLNDAQSVFEIASAFDPSDSFARPYEKRRPSSQKLTIGIPAQEDLEFFGNQSHERAFTEYVQTLKENPNVRTKTIQLKPFIKAASLLYQGPWVAERYAAVGGFLEEKPQAFHPVTSGIISGAKSLTAIETFQSLYTLQELKRLADAQLNGIDCIITPTTGTHYTLEEVLADPLQTNTNLGFYTNFMNLLDYSAIAIPACRTAKGLPFGITLFSHAHSDHALISFAGSLLGERIESKLDKQTMELAVCGAHMDGLPLNHQLLELGATFVRKEYTSKHYKFFCLTKKQPIRPGMIRASKGGNSIEMEIWEMPIGNIGLFLGKIVEPLGLGSIETIDGGWVYGFQCEAYAIETATDITDYGSWRKYLETLS